MSDFLGKLRANEPLRLILWPIILGLVGYLVTKGTIDTNAADLITAVALLILGGSGIEAARMRVTAGAHVIDAVAATIEQVRGRVADALGQPGIDALTHLEQMLQTTAEGRGAHERE